MYGKLVVLFAFAALAFAREYPAGLFPAFCPDYPNCDPSVMARFTPEGMPIPEWEYPGYGFYRTIIPAAVPIIPEALPIVEPAKMMEALKAYPAAYPAIPEAVKYPADFDSSKCPNYPMCSEVVEPMVPEPLPETKASELPEAAKYPADFDSAKCPDYPNCSEVVEPMVPEPLPKVEEAETPEAAKYPADFDSEKCPNYPTCL